MHKKFEINRTKIKGNCQSGRKVVPHNSKSDLPLRFMNYSTLPNKRTGSNKRTGGEICPKLISAQDLINAQG